jgi:hypothetical protein
MKRAALCILFVAFFTSAALPFQLGAEFSAGDATMLGLNLRFSHLFELKPQVGFLLSEDINSFYLHCDGNFYFTDIAQLQHYAGFAIIMNTISHTDATFTLNGHYGLRYNFNDVFSIFGEGGIGVIVKPFILSTFKGGLGCTIYFPNFK